MALERISFWERAEKQSFIVGFGIFADIVRRCAEEK